MKTRRHWWVAAFAVLFVHTAMGQALPDLVPMDLQAPASLTGPPNMTARVAWNISNLGAGPALGYWTDVLYLSQNPWLDGTAPYVTGGSGPGPLEPGEDYWRTNRVTLPVTETGS